MAYGAAVAVCNLLASGVFATAALAEPVTVVALGDSLTAGYGLPEDRGLVPQLQSWLKKQGRDVQVVNAGVSGDTTAGGLARVDWSLVPGTDALIVELGANDMLRGLDPKQARANLDAILAKAKERGLPVLLVGIPAPLNYGAEYKRDFDAMYPDLSRKYATLLMPNLLAPLLADGADPSSAARYFQSDGLHPNAKGVRMIVDGLGPEVLLLLDRVKP